MQNSMDSKVSWFRVLLMVSAAFFVVEANIGPEDISIPHRQPLPQADRFDGAKAEASDSDSPHRPVVEEIEDFEAQLEDLESTLKAKHLTLQDKEKKISILESELGDVQKKSNKDLEERLVVARNKVQMLELQVGKLQDDVRKLEAQLEGFKDLAESSEATITELLNKNSQAMKTIERQKKRIQGAEEALRIAEAVLKKAESEAKQKIEKLSKAAEAWLPTWLANLLDSVRQFAITKWGEHGEPVVTIITDQAYQVSATALELAQPHLKMIKEKLMPAVQQHWENAVLLIGPHIEMVKVKAGEGVESAKSYLSPPIHTMQETLSPFTQLVRGKVRPCVDKAVVFFKPCFKSTYTALQSCMQKTHKVYQDLLKPIGDHHSQMLTSLYNNISKHQALAALISEEVALFLASALLLLLALGILLVCSSAFSGKKTMEYVPNSGGTHSESAHKKKMSKQVD